MKVFIASSVQSINDARMLAELVEEVGHEPLPWNKPGLFPLGNYVLESLLQISRTVDAAIIIFNEDVPVWYRGNPVVQPRDNVLIEYGIFLQALGLKRTIICRRGSAKIATDLQGLIYCDLGKTYKAQNTIIEWLSSLDGPGEAAIR